MRLILYVFLICLMVISISADSKLVDDAMKECKDGILQQTDILNSLRESISKEKLPLTMDIIGYESHAASLNDEYKILKHDIMHYEQSLTMLETEVSVMREKNACLNDMILEHRKNFSKNISPAENILYQNSLEVLDKQLLNNHPFKMPSLLKQILKLSLSEIKLNLGGGTFSGKCLIENGELLSGTFIKWGEMIFFVSDNVKAAGLIHLKLNSQYPSLVYSINPVLLKDILDGKQAFIPVDVTSGKALKLRSVNKSLLEHIRTGGVIMIPILVLGMFSLVVAICKFFNLRKVVIDIPDILSLVIKNINNNSVDKAVSLTDSLPSPFSFVLLEGIHNYHKSREELEEVMYEKVLLQIPYLEKWLSFLSVTAATAPLLGLLGTVMGMINTFKMVSMFGAGNSNVLSGGISEALITTEFGLIVAIPTLLMHAYLAKKVKIIIHTLEQLMISFINLIKIKDN